jgi:hypothetical protein
LASSDSHSCETLAEYAGVAIPTELRMNGIVSGNAVARPNGNRVARPIRSLQDDLYGYKNV